MRLIVRSFFVIIIGFISIKGYCQSAISCGFGLEPNYTILNKTSPSNGLPKFNNENSLGLGFGAFLRYKNTSNFSYILGIKRISRSFLFSDEGLNIGQSYRIFVRDFEIPFSASYILKLKKSLFLNMTLGAALDIFPIHNKNLSIVGVSDSVYFQEVLIPGGVAGSAFGGLGLDWELKNDRKICLGISYHAGFKNILKSVVINYPYSTSESTTVTNFKGNYFAIDINYYFSLSKRKSSADNSGHEK